jgi:hypothetical protein
MATRNHSRRVHAPFEQYPGIDRGQEFGDRGESRMERRERRGYGEETWEGRGDMGRVQGVAARHPYTTVLTSFGVGFGFGLFVTLLLTRREESWFERYAPESIQNLPDRLQDWSNRLQDVPDRLKRVPEAVSSYVPSSWKRWW